MNLIEIEVNNYRNYKEKVNIKFDNSLNILLGDNAQGKTNLLEAIYYLSFGQSFRAKKDMDLVNFNSQFFKVKGTVNDNSEEFSVEYKYIYNKKKEAYINGVKCTNISDAAGKLKAVVFSPDHLSLIKGSPVLRRNFIDAQIIQIQPKFIYYLRQYRIVLAQRNNLLKKGYDDQNLEVWNQQLCSLGAKIINARVRAIYHLKSKIEYFYKNITDNNTNLEIFYTSTVGNIEGQSENEVNERMYKKLLDSKDKELLKRFTFIGPHRDDLIIYLDGKELKQFGSQGQQRIAVLSLKLAELDFIEEYSYTSPLLLLDDIMSELDAQKRNAIFNVLDKVQTFITATEEDYLSKQFLKNANINRVVKGTIR